MSFLYASGKEWSHETGFVQATKDGLKRLDFLSLPAGVGRELMARPHR